MNICQYTGCDVGPTIGYAIKLGCAWKPGLDVRGAWGVSAGTSLGLSSEHLLCFLELGAPLIIDV